ncbi:uncharacterized protein LOC130778669 [Actinidia eriantha]|uniref:uncharacterized protein LOC130778669 n=1 Tax=Actinidia eriantha TaxID=165200 RepID=UPI00258CF789|nr:uncharacterized protein LOC130778669 [Actinidia eriantha]
MSEGSQTSQTTVGSTTPTVTPGQIVVSNENPNLRITTTLFDGTNYLSWSKSATLFLKSRGKIRYINGTITSLNFGDPGFDKWDQENSLIMSWLIHSMIPEIGEGFLSLDTAKDIWDTVSETYSRRGNIAQVYDLQRRVDSLDQGEMTSLQYYSALTTLWQRLDHLADYTPICSADITAFRKFIDRQRVFKFLAGLRDEYDQVRCRILNINPVPSLREAFAIIQNEESRRGVMLPPIPSERSALVSVPQSERRNQPTHRDSGPSVGSDDKDKLHCDYCQRPRHTRETCWRLHGRPPTRGRGSRSGSAGGRDGSSRAHHSTVVEPPSSGSESIALSSTEIELIRNVMSRLDTSTGASSSFAHSGPDKVKIADGTFSSVSGKGSSNEDDDWQW